MTGHEVGAASGGRVSRRRTSTSTCLHACSATASVHDRRSSNRP